MDIRKVTLGNDVIRWEVRYYVAGRGSTRLRRRFETKADAQAFATQRLMEQEQQLSGVASRTQSFEETTLRRESEHWLAVQGPRFSPGHMRRVQCVLRKLIPRYGNFSPDKFHPGVLSKIQAELLSSGLKPASVNRDLEVITATLNFSTKQRRIPYNPCVGFQKLREVRDDIDFWEREEAESFLSFANEKYPFGSSRRWVYAVYLLALNTGLRAGEIWGLEPSDIKQNGEVLHVQRQFDRVNSTFRPTKGRENRRVPCNKALLEVVQALITQTDVSARKIMFSTKTGKPICHDNFKKRKFDCDVREWGGKPLVFHGLRHTAITLMLANGLDISTVQNIAGHKEVKTTMKYAHLLAERIRFAARSFAVIPEAASASKGQKSFLRVIK